MTSDLSTRNKIGFYAAYIAMGLLAVAVGIFLYWTYQPDDVLEVRNAPVPIRTIREHPAADGVVILKVDYCKKVSATGRVRISFVSKSREVFLPVGEDKQPPVCMLTEYPVLIPHEILGDTYKIKFRITYQINPIKTHIEEFESKEFEVVDMQ